MHQWSLTTQRQQLVKIGTKIVLYIRFFTFQIAVVAMPKELFRKILNLIDDLQRPPLRRSPGKSAWETR